MMIEEVLDKIQNAIGTYETIAKAVLFNQKLIVITVAVNGQFPFHPPYVVEGNSSIEYADINNGYSKAMKGGEVVYEDRDLIKRAHMRTCRSNAPSRSDDTNWITVNGTHIPLDEQGVAKGGPSALKGNNFAMAESKQSKAKNLPDDGGVASSGGNPLVARGPIKERLKQLGHTQESIDRAKNLFDRHSGSDRGDQTKADAEIAKHIADGDDIGKLLKDKAKMEEQAWKDQIAASNIEAKKQYEEQVSDMRHELEPGGMLSGYTESDLKDMNLWPVEPEPVEPKFYRKGGMDRDVLAFTTNPNGAGMSYLTEGESGYIGSNQEFTLGQMKKLGYRPIAGIQGMDVGTVGESEVLFAKFPMKEDEGFLKSSEFAVETLIDDADLNFEDELLESLKQMPESPDLQMPNADEMDGEEGSLPGDLDLDSYDYEMDDIWKTMNGTHVLIDENGYVSGGTDNLKARYGKPQENVQQSKMHSVYPDTIQGFKHRTQAEIKKMSLKQLLKVARPLAIWGHAYGSMSKWTQTEDPSHIVDSLLPLQSKTSLAKTIWRYQKEYEAYHK